MPCSKCESNFNTRRFSAYRWIMFHNLKAWNMITCKSLRITTIYWVNTLSYCPPQHIQYNSCHEGHQIHTQRLFHRMNSVLFYKTIRYNVALHYISSPDRHVSGLWEEFKAPGGNPHRLSRRAHSVHRVVLHIELCSKTDFKSLGSYFKVKRIH